MCCQGDGSLRGDNIWQNNELYVTQLPPPLCHTCICLPPLSPLPLVCLYLSSLSLSTLFCMYLSLSPLPVSPSPSPSPSPSVCTCPPPPPPPPSVPCRYMKITDHDAGEGGIWDRERGNVDPRTHRHEHTTLPSSGVSRHLPRPAPPMGSVASLWTARQVYVCEPYYCTYVGNSFAL